MRQFLGLWAVGIGWLVLVSSCPGQEEDKEFQKRVDQAVEKAVVHLKSLQQPDGTWRYAQYTAGTTTLVTWALLEAGVPSDDKVMTKALSYIRLNSLTETNTYNISLAIFLFDRMGEERDIPLIESLAYRLLAGQNLKGGWSYSNPQPPPAEIERLRKWVTDPPADKGQDNIKNRKLSPEIAAQVSLLKARQPGQITELPGDNSNTQFAMIALWASKKHGIPVEDAMRQVSVRFRGTQWPDGTWKYENMKPGDFGVLAANQTPAMTCAGLLGLALGHAVDPNAEKKTLLADPQVVKGMEYLYDVMKHPENQGVGYTQKQYYFLWSLERVAVVYNIAKIKDVDWYRWGADLLLARQGADGSWRAQYEEGGIDTCFGVLFLKRVNVVEDLTVKIADPPPKVEDPIKPPSIFTLQPLVINPNVKNPKDPVKNPTGDPNKEPVKPLFPPTKGTDPKKDPPKPLFPKTTSSVDPMGQRVPTWAARDRSRAIPVQIPSLVFMPGRERFRPVT